MANKALHSDGNSAALHCRRWPWSLCVGKRKYMTPTAFKEDGYRFFFFSREEERMHIHILSSDRKAKFWLESEIELAKNYNYPRKQLKTIACGGSLQ